MVLAKNKGGYLTPSSFLILFGLCFFFFFLARENYQTPPSCVVICSFIAVHTSCLLH